MIVLTRRKKGEESETLEFRTFGEAKQADFGYKHAWIRCDSCEMLTINGMACHEHGCPGERAERQEEDHEVLADCE